MKAADVIARLPYTDPFLFVDRIDHISERTIQGTYRFRSDAFFYRGHFKDYPVTPGVILLECMAQIALVCQGIYLLEAQGKPIPQAIAFSSASVDFFKPVLPETEVVVNGELVYFRLGKLKSKATLKIGDELACKAELSGMIGQ